MQALSWSTDMTLIVILSHWAGLINYLILDKDKDEFKITDCIRQMLIGGFIGFVCAEYQATETMPMNLTSIDSVIAAYVGNPVLKLITDRIKP